MPNLTPFLLFDGNCAEAMGFYQSCLGGELTLIKLADTPMKDNAAPEHHHKVAYAHLKSSDMEFSATIGCTRRVAETGKHGRHVRRWRNKQRPGRHL